MRHLGMFSCASFCSIKYVVVKTLTEKNQPVTQTKRPHCPIRVIFSQFGIGNQCLKRTVRPSGIVKSSSLLELGQVVWKSADADCTVADRGSVKPFLYSVEIVTCQVTWYSLGYIQQNGEESGRCREGAA